MSAGSRAVGKTVMKVAGGRLFPIGAFLRSPASRALVTAARSSGRAVRGSLRAGAEASGRARAFLARVLTKDPIDVASGEVVLRQVDAEFPGVLPLVLERTHLSSYRAGSLFGPSWASTLDQRIEIDSEGVCFAAEDGMVLTFPAPAPGTPVRPERGPLRTLAVTPGGEYTVTDPLTGRTAHFPARGPYGTVPITAITDRNGNRIDFERDEAGILRTVRHSGGYTVDVEVDAGRVRALRLRTGDGPDADPVLVRFGYDEQGRLTEVVNSSGEPLRFSYDAQGRLTEWIDRNGAWYRYAYDAEGRGVRGEGRDGFLNVALAYDVAGRTTTVTDSLGERTVYHLNEAGQVVAEVDPLGRVTRSEWDRNDRLLSRTDPLGRTTRYRYDEAGNLTEVVRPDGNRTRAVYDASGRPTEVTEADGAVWRYAYDGRANLVAATDPLGATTRYTHDEHGCLATVTDPMGGVTRITGNAAGLPVEITDPMGGTTRYAHDPFGRVSAITDPLGGVTRLTWTPEGRPASRTLPGGATETWSYDAEGNLARHVDALGNVTRFESTFDHTTARTDPDGGRLEFAYDTELRLSAVTNEQGLVWRYEYDPAGDLVAETDFNGRELRYAHDAAGQLVTRVTALGETTRYVRDLLGNVTERRGPRATATFAYDLAGRLVRAVNPDADVRFERDRMGRITAEVCNGRTLWSQYDAAGRRVRRRTPSGTESLWSYDRAGRPVAVRTAERVLRFAYDAAGRETRRYIGDGALLEQRWDADHRLSAQTLWGAPRTVAGRPAEPVGAAGPAGVGEPRLLQHRAYAYRADGHLTDVSDRLLGHRRFDVGATGRVTAVRADTWNERYAYDASGNLTEAGWPTSPDQAEAGGDAVGGREYAGTLLRRAGNIRYEYDAEGRVVARRHKRPSAKPLTWRYTWDSEDRLVAVTTPEGAEWRYLYDALGRRVGKRRVGPDGRTVVEETAFVWDGTVLAEQADGVRRPSGATDVRTTVWEHLPGDHRPIIQAARTWAAEAPQRWIDEQFHAIVTDLAGTPTELVAPDGEVAWHARATLWGMGGPEPHDAVTCPLRFAGQYHDRETGLAYNYFRHYDPANARYLTSDPLGLAAAPNPYAYVANPARWIDPHGLMPYPAHSVRGLPRSLDKVTTGPGDCKTVAEKIQRSLGAGEVRRFDAAPYPVMGPYRGQHSEWSHHYAVIHEGRAYDAFTPREGVPIDEYKQFFEYNDVINFGF
ncbi:DUF6531 domain-containing protein [Actinoallomurus rhizosphaericola]|uniref:DUF6531 domain-containing protein n=1 Tax=Actinoallomurus rhizosphaericola TaxID=2952536 RepID=UPI002093C41F|nr:DUF6531 domain-containing protein [Actinoallomurus rhizosphaericola]MCO5996145.1 DUF6531 domain-containing protein [Actinoallomurus rhizosphaericola]